MGNQQSEPEATGKKGRGRGVRDFTAEELRQSGARISELADDLITCGDRTADETRKQIVPVDGNRTLATVIELLENFVGNWAKGLVKQQQAERQEDAANQSVGDEPSATEPRKTAKSARKK